HRPSNLGIGPQSELERSVPDHLVARVSEELRVAFIEVHETARRGPHDGNGQEVRIEDALEPHAGGLDLELGHLEIVNVRAGTEPLEDLAEIVTDGYASNQPPPIVAVR